jgi:hypothetical protein
MIFADLRRRDTKAVLGLDHFENQLTHGTPSQRRVIVEIADELVAERRQSRRNVACIAQPAGGQPRAREQNREQNIVIAHVPKVFGEPPDGRDIGMCGSLKVIAAPSIARRKALYENGVK